MILSGGAEGIDTAAHEGAISAGAPTVVVAPSAFDRPFPEKNRALFQRIIRDGGGHITAEPPHTPAANPKFFPRNSYLAALAHVLVVVESPIRSGARNAAKWARRLGRPLFVVPAVPWNPHGVGCIAELKLGARPLAGPKDVLRVLSQSAFHWLPMADGGVRTAGCPAPAPPAAPDQQTLGTFITYPPGSPAGTLLAAVSAGAGNVDGIAQRTGLAPTKVEELLLTLAKDGVLVADPSGAVKFVNR